MNIDDQGGLTRAPLAAPAVAAPAAAGSNDEATAAWNGVLFDKFVRFRSILTTGCTRHSDAALSCLSVAPGARALDVGCGFGDVTSVLARVVGAAGWVRGVDVADRFVDAARTDARRAGVANAEFFRADAQGDPLGGPYDLVFSRFGTMFFASPVAAMRNLKSISDPTAGSASSSGANARTMPGYTSRRRSSATSCRSDTIRASRPAVPGPSRWRAPTSRATS